MINAYDTWNTFIKGLNSIDEKYLFIKSNMIHNIPPYPYATVGILTPYIQDKDSLRGTITHSYNGTGITMQSMKEPQISFSLTFYTDNYESVFKFMQDTINWLETRGKQYLFEHDIILVEHSNFIDKSTILETEYVYKYGFDVRFRVADIVSMDIDNIESVEVKNKVNNENLTIEGGNKLNG
ncbi:hypothetical protein FDF74_11390 [Clostridium niameyense]|uniref:Phage neck terminator protein gp12-like domain-containing protein n=1 Tax=Clostridium niameyense TaxID=1622073 RepID=A0A6M0RC16_9CLOT|nr:hypothetical protein [Clostridium niameyense]NEZ47784.1 hypothetical protein [Clostridium niameyense]